MWHGLEGIGWGWIGIGAIHMALFWALVVLALIALVTGLTDAGARRGETRPIDIVKARYARGELTREQFEQLRRDLAH